MSTGLLAAEGTQGEGEGTFHAPELDELFPGEILLEGTPFALTRITLVQLLMTLVVATFFVVAFRKPQVVPRGMQNLGEVAVDFVRVHIIDAAIGEKGRTFLPYLASMFFFILALNLAGTLPGLNIAGTAIVVVPLLLALTSWVVFNTVGIRKHGFVHYVKMNIFPPGVPKPLYLLLTPIEFISTFVLRPVTLTIRLMANMMSGHFMLTLFFAGATYLLLYGEPLLKPFGAVSALMGLIFVLFELLIAFLQAYIFTLLTAVYIAGALSEEH